MGPRKAEDKLGPAVTCWRKRSLLLPSYNDKSMLYCLTIFDFWYSAYLFFGLGPFYLIWSEIKGFYIVFEDLGVIANFYAYFVFALVNQASPKTVTKVAFATTFE